MFVLKNIVNVSTCVVVFLMKDTLTLCTGIVISNTDIVCSCKEVDSVLCSTGIVFIWKTVNVWACSF